MLGIKLREITWSPSKERVVSGFEMSPNILHGISYVLMAISFSKPPAQTAPQHKWKKERKKKKGRKKKKQRKRKEGGGRKSAHLLTRWLPDSTPLLSSESFPCIRMTSDSKVFTGPCRRRGPFICRNPVRSGSAPAQRPMRGEWRKAAEALAAPRMRGANILRTPSCSAQPACFAP